MHDILREIQMKNEFFRLDRNIRRDDFLVTQTIQARLKRTLEEEDREILKKLKEEF